MKSNLKDRAKQYALGVVTLTLISGAFQAGYADQIPYGSVGSYNATTYSFTAASTGDVIAYFAGGSGAGYDNQLGLRVDGILTSAGYGLDNHTSGIGDFINLGHVNAGQTMVFVLKNLTLDDYAYSDPTMNGAYDANDATGHNHIYSTSYTSGLLPGVPMGTYVAFEDLRFPNSDYNYNDENFVFTTVPSPVPEPISMLLFGTGITCLAGVARRRNTKKA